MVAPLERTSPRRLLASPDDGTIKLYLTWTALNHRKANASLYQSGSYRPLEADGEHKINVVAFARQAGGPLCVGVAPRLVAGLMGEEAASPPIGRAWEATRLILPDTAPAGRWRNLLTNTVTEVRRVDGHSTLELARRVRRVAGRAAGRGCGRMVEYA